MSAVSATEPHLTAYAEALTAWARIGDDTLVARVEPIEAPDDDEGRLALVRSVRPAAVEQSIVFLLADADGAQWLVCIGVAPSGNLARAFREHAVVLAWRSGAGSGRSRFTALAFDAVQRSAYGDTSVSATPKTVVSEEPSALAGEYAARRVSLGEHTVVVAPPLRELLAAVWASDERHWLVHALEDES